MFIEPRQWALRYSNEQYEVPAFIELNIPLGRDTLANKFVAYQVARSVTNNQAKVGRMEHRNGRIGFIFVCKGRPFCKGPFGKDKKKVRGHMMHICYPGRRNRRELHLKLSPTCWRNRKDTVPGKGGAGGDEGPGMREAGLSYARQE